MHTRHKKAYFGVFALLAALSFITAYRLAFPINLKSSDFYFHFWFAQHFDKDFLFINFAYYALNYLIGLVTTTEASGVFVVITVFSLLNASKGLVIFQEINRRSGQTLTPIQLFLLSTGCAIAVAYILPAYLPDLLNVNIPKIHMFFNRANMTVWHNATCMLLFPVALMVTHQSIRILKNENTPKSTACMLPLLTIATVAIKPSFVMVFIPAASLILFSKLLTGSFSQFWHSYRRLIVALFVGGVILVLQYLAIYMWESPYDRVLYSGQAHKLAFEFNNTLWPSQNPFLYNILLFLSPFVFPLFVLVRYRKTAFSDTGTLLTGAMLVIGILVALFVVEEGTRRTHNNFIWQAIIASFLFFVNATLFYLKQKPFSKSLGWALWFGHVLCGLFYIVRILIWPSYL